MLKVTNIALAHGTVHMTEIRLFSTLPFNTPDINFNSTSQHSGKFPLNSGQFPLFSVKFPHRSISIPPNVSTIFNRQTLFHYHWFRNHSKLQDDRINIDFNFPHKLLGDTCPTGVSYSNDIQ